MKWPKKLLFFYNNAFFHMNLYPIRSMLWVEWGWDGTEVQEGEDICIHIADSLHCTAETNTTL